MSEILSSLNESIISAAVSLRLGCVSLFWGEKGCCSGEVAAIGSSKCSRISFNKSFSLETDADAEAESDADSR